MAMFKNPIRFTGKHALILQKYSKDKGSEQDIPFQVSNNSNEKKLIYIFETRLHCYMVAGMFGIIKNRKADIDTDKSNNATATIFADILDKQRSNLERMYHQMVLTRNDDLSADERIKKAFSIIPDDQCDAEQKKLEDYVRGGLEVIDEMFSLCLTYEDVCNKMYEFNELLDYSIASEE